MNSSNGMLCNREDLWPTYGEGKLCESRRRQVMCKVQLKVISELTLPHDGSLPAHPRPFP